MTTSRRTADAWDATYMLTDLDSGLQAAAQAGRLAFSGRSLQLGEQLLRLQQPLAGLGLEVDDRLESALVDEGWLFLPGRWPRTRARLTDARAAVADLRAQLAIMLETDGSLDEAVPRSEWFAAEEDGPRRRGGGGYSRVKSTKPVYTAG